MNRFINFQQLVLYKDFPSTGVYFYDMENILYNTKIFRQVVDDLARQIRKQIDVDDSNLVLAGLDSRGYILMSALSFYFMDMAMVMVAKAGKLPGKVKTISASKEYGSSEFCVKPHLLKPGSKVIVVDDLLATGNSAVGAAELIESCGENVKVVAFAFVTALAGCPENQLEKCQDKEVDFILGHQTIKERFPHCAVFQWAIAPTPNVAFLKKTSLLEEKKKSAPSGSTVGDDTHDSDGKIIMYQQKYKILPFIQTLDDAFEKHVSRFSDFNYSPSIYEKSLGIVFIWHPAYESWAKRLFGLIHMCNNHGEFSGLCSFHRIKYNSFPDGCPDVEMNAHVIRNRHVIFIMNSCDLGAFQTQRWLAGIIPLKGCLSLHLWNPYLLTMTHERVEPHEGVLAASECLLSELKSTIPVTSSGLPHLYTADIHDVRERFYGGQKGMIHHEISGLEEFLTTVVDIPNTALVFPDQGADKRFSAVAKRLKVQYYTCKKQRLAGEDRLIEFEQNIDTSENIPKMLIIVDDLIQSGSTALKTGLLLKKMKQFQHCTLALYATHLRFPKKSILKFIDPQLESSHVFETIYGSNSIPFESIVNESSSPLSSELIEIYKKKFHVVPLELAFLKSTLQKINYSRFMMYQNMMYRIHMVKSNSTVKKQAIMQALSAYNVINVQFVYESSSTNTICQPVGYKETLKCVKNRIHADDDVAQSCNSIVLESGIVANEQGVNEDITLGGIVCKVNGKDVLCTFDQSKSTAIPSTLWLKYTDAHPQKEITFGQFLKKSNIAQNDTDWHLNFGPRSRKQILKELLLKDFFNNFSFINGFEVIHYLQGIL